LRIDIKPGYYSTKPAIVNEVSGRRGDPRSVPWTCLTREFEVDTVYHS